MSCLRDVGALPAYDGNFVLGDGNDLIMAPANYTETHDYGPTGGSYSLTLPADAIGVFIRIFSPDGHSDDSEVVPDVNVGTSDTLDIEIDSGGPGATVTAVSTSVLLDSMVSSSSGTTHVRVIVTRQVPYFHLFNAISLALLDSSFAPKAGGHLWWVANSGSSGPIYYLVTDLGFTTPMHFHASTPGGSDSYVGDLTAGFSFQKMAAYSPVDGVIYAYDSGLCAIDPATAGVTRITTDMGESNSDLMVVTSDGAVWFTVGALGNELHRYLAADGETILDLSIGGYSTSGIGSWKTDPTKVWLADGNASLVDVFAYSAGVIALDTTDICGGTGGFQSPPFGNIDRYNGSRWNADWSQFAVGVMPEVWLWGKAGGWGRRRFGGAGF